jgi:hypothetical protein
MNKSRRCHYCSVPSVKYRCVSCDCTGKIEIPKNIVWHSDRFDDFTIVGTDYLTCDNCKGRGWILVSQSFADQFPKNALEYSPKFRDNKDWKPRQK